MRKVRLVILGFIILSLLSIIPDAGAELVRIELTCRYCGKPFIGLQAPDIIYSAGVDSDFCTHSSSGSGRAFEVQTCPACGYSATTQECLSQALLTEEQKKSVKAVIDAHWKNRSFKGQEEIPIGLKFLIATEIMKASGSKATEIGRVAHLGSWAIRDKITFRALGEEFASPLKAIALYDAQKEKGINSPKDFNMAFVMLQLSVRLGFPASRNALMNKIITAAPGFFSQNDAKKLAEQLESFREDVKDEAYFMTVAADMFEKALSEEADISESEKDNLSYLVGELRRRCGNPEQAEKWLKKTLGNTARSDLKKLIPVLLAHSESATGISTGVFPEITCPLCGKKTRYLKYSEPDYLGGKDTDFATYSLDPSTYCTEVICCLNCLYSNYRNGFHAALLPEQREALNAVLEPQRGRIAVTSPHGFKAWERYELVAKCFEALGKPSEQVGMVLVNGAWCARRALCSPTMEIDLVDGILYPKLAEEKAEALADGTFDGYYVAMLISHRAGLTEIRDSYLKKASKMTLDDPAREALMKSAKNIISQEERILREVVSKFEIVSEQVPFYRMYLFIMGDSYRRIGEERKAKKIYKRCADMTEVGEVAKKLLEQL